MKSKTIKIVTPILILLFISMISLQALANPPDNMILDYNVSTSELDVTITHPTLDPNTHYIYKIDIEVNGELILSEQYTSQPSDTFTYTYTVMTNEGDEISVTAICSLFGSLTKTLIVPNENAPNAPDINGPSNGKPGIEYDYTFVTDDPNEDNVFYYIEWGDGTNTGWIGPYPSGGQITQNHTWDSRGSYTITAKAKDPDENEGLTSIYEVSIPRMRQIQTFSDFIKQYIEFLLYRFPLIQKLFL